MKTEKRLFAILAFALLFCMMLTCASAAVEDKKDQPLIFLMQTNAAEAAETQEDAEAEPERVFKLPAMLQVIEDDAFAGTSVAQADDRLRGTRSDRPVVTVPVASLPAMLERIGDQAFEGTAVVVVELPETVESIGDRAFAGNPHLRIIRIPEKTQYIAHNAFAGSHQVMISGSSGSYARSWAGKHGIPFSPITMITAGNQNLSGLISLNSSDIETIETASGEGMDHPPVRRNDEIKAEVYEQQIAHQVQGRSPPFCA